MITLEIVIRLHEASLARYGGGPGIRARGALESAITRPYATFGGEDLYPSAIENAATIDERIIVNHLL